jgi:hypothetical protein
MNKTLMEKSRCMLNGARLGKEFWAEVVGTACYLVKKSLSSVLDDKTPQEVWTGKEPSLTHLKVFREMKDVSKQEVLPSKEEPEKIEFDLKDDESNSTEEQE